MNKLTLLHIITLLSTLACSLAQPLRIAYSDWPGWVAWQIAIDKNWFKEEGVEVQFEWFEYVPSMEAFAAGQVDAVCMSNGDTLVTGANGSPSKMILINDYSNGNDMVVARPGISSIPELKGKKVGVEVGFLSHLLLLKALEKHGMKESDVTLVNIPTHETPKALASGDVDAIVAWQPNSGQALQAVPRSKAIFTTRDVPGLIYDVLAVNPASLATRSNDWQKVVKVWYRVVDFLLNPANEPEALRILSARVNLTPEQYRPFLAGTKILTLEEAARAYEKTDDLSSLYGSCKNADAFNVANNVYKTPQDVAAYIEPSLTLKLLKKP
ncbi:MAG: ABC transporter substrate-binding protein [Chthoniobacterales bacterium]|nr:ABC transporter substrate-binding protein [Chthoniobacterales bacterium]